MQLPTIVIIPGNGNSHIDTDNWYAWVRDELQKSGFPVVATDMPDPVEARMKFWLPYITNHLITDHNSIVIGHSSGAVATLRYLEHQHVLGAVLVGCNYTDLGYEDEKASGWYDAPWEWGTIKSNANWIVQFHSDNDPFITLAEPQFIQKQLDSDLRIIPNRGHFMTDHNPINTSFPELVALIKSKKPLS